MYSLFNNSNYIMAPALPLYIPIEHVIVVVSKDI